MFFVIEQETIKSERVKRYKGEKAYAFTLHHIL